MKEKLYRLINQNREINQEDFEMLLSTIDVVDGVGITKINKGKAEVFYENSRFKAQMELGEENLKPSVKLILDNEDSITINFLKRSLNNLGYRIFAERLGCFLPKEPNLYECISETYVTKDEEILEKLNYKPVFWFYNTYSYFALKKPGNTVHMINDCMFKYFLESGDIEETPEFSYKVANSIEEFVMKADEDLIPNNFYKFYKKSLKILNYSNLDIEKPTRKTFVKPLIYEIDNVKKGFYQINTEKGAMLYADKIRPDENLDKTLKRVLKENLNLSSDYLYAAVSRSIDFDRDKNGRLTPRLNVYVYIDKPKVTAKSKTTRNWLSIDQVKI